MQQTGRSWCYREDERRIYITFKRNIGDVPSKIYYMDTGVWRIIIKKIQNIKVKYDAIQVVIVINRKIHCPTILAPEILGEKENWLVYFLSTVIWRIIKLRITLSNQPIILYWTDMFFPRIVQLVLGNRIIIILLILFRYFFHKKKKRKWKRKAWFNS